MKLLTDLFSTDYGLMSIVGLAFIICAMGFFLWLVMDKMKRDPTAPREQATSAPVGSPTATLRDTGVR